MKLEHAFRRTYIWALLITALLALVAFVVHARAAEVQMSITERIDLTLTVRTNMHSIAFLANRLVIVSKSAEGDSMRREIQQTLERLDNSYTQLLLAMQAPSVVATQSSLPDDFSQNVTAFMDAAHTLSSTEIVTINTNAYQQIVRLRSELLTELNLMADNDQRENDLLVKRHEHTELSLLVLMLLTLGLEGAFIFLPMERRILKTQRDLQAEVERSQTAAIALKNSEARYRDIFEGNPTVKLLINPQDGRIVEANRAASAFYGYSLDQLKGMTLEDISILPPSVIVANMREVLAGTKSVIYAQSRLASGELRNVEIFTGTLSVGDKPSIYAIVQDVTKRTEAEEALRESEARYRGLFEQTSDGIFILGLDGKLLVMNQSAIDMLGYTREEIDHHPIPQLSAESGDSLQVLERLVAGEHIGIYERLFRKKDGQVFPVEINAELVRKSDGSPLHIQSIARDISQRKQAEQALLESEKLYRTLVRNMPATGVIMFDAAMRYTLVEGPFLKQFPHWRGAIGKRPQDVIPQDIIDFALQINERVLKGETFTYERTTPEYTYQAHAIPLRDETGQITGGMILMHDITELKKAEEALRTSEQRLRLITDSIQDVITQTNVDNEITFASPSYLAMLGYEPTELIGKSSTFLVHPDDLARYSQRLAAALTSPDHQVVIEGRLLHRDRRVIWTETVGKLLFDEQGTHSGAVYVTREITERRRLEQALIEQEKLRTALEKEQELSTLKSQMMEVISHEFRTPLAVIQLSIGTLTEYYDRITPEQRDTKFSTITERIQRIADMLNELDIIVRGGFVPSMVTYTLVDFAALCRTVAADLEHEHKLSNKYDLEMVAPAVLYGDPMMLHTAIKHIMCNAARFSRPSEVVKISLTQRDQGFEFRVVDIGIGIPTQEQTRLFQPFFRGSNIGAIGGLGLGLTIARSAVEAHRGTIRVESAEGVGTTIIVWLPLGRPL